MAIRHPDTNEPIHSIGDFDAMVQSLVPQADQIVEVTPLAHPEMAGHSPQTQALMENAFRNAERARTQGNVGQAAVTGSVDARPVDEEAPTGQLPAMVQKARLAQLRSGAAEPEVKDSVYSDLGGGRYTYYQEGTLDPKKLEPIVHQRGWGWNSTTRRNETGIRVELGDRQIFVPDDERFGDIDFEQRLARAEQILRSGGGRLVRKKAKK